MYTFMDCVCRHTHEFTGPSANFKLTAIQPFQYNDNMFISQCCLGSRAMVRIYTGSDSSLQSVLTSWVQAQLTATVQIHNVNLSGHLLWCCRMYLSFTECWVYNLQYILLCLSHSGNFFYTNAVCHAHKHEWPIHYMVTAILEYLTWWLLY